MGIVKGVLLSICPSARLIDLTHDLAPQDIRGASLALDAALPFFPEGTVHLVVVTPGWGAPGDPSRSARAGTTWWGPITGSSPDSSRGPRWSP